ncbi:facilitated trehalose transporter Tret1-2 homolog isoform X2 [Tribolium castaneum]|uniref:Facilitated trehalose transporter Tret1-2 homolog-like Protein n=1 Tax=Tribolium castaneum TaxID=7070 RepID=D2A490_TRICA|nr:PREDICTED: facilitated trehalose transporter Tret1-2 homolog isoform X2 [Tribolium castaneum]XP_971034.1 PREDICTED: facilitated trehalose transporter Tret1-2 homolog isoform X2 [Tribolium castaneum]EFA04827.1 Facilitated trehalose transporter Tret1-2 homolog-like Protein [Tribolium castaneum]|eukprot:XP_008195038.1 PREDICTED: facilitated trehalose transporter Tret1-2 homolog isoform X2 [Tribolium castaneum]
MDAIGGSCYSLNILENEKKIREEKEREDKFNETVGSRGSISRYEGKSFKTLLPQMLAAAIGALFHVVVGISFAYSAILLPQLNAEDSDLKITKDQGSWIASVVTITIPVSGITCGFLMDSIGRLNTVKLAMIPAVVGWIIIATSKSVLMMIIGRIITGFAAAWGTSPAMVYITEIARADMRGSLMSFAPAYTSLGVVLAYFEGWLMNWRTVAWVCLVYAILPFILVMFIPESPAWLIAKGRNEQAKKSINWLNKYQPRVPSKNDQTFAQVQFEYLIREHEEKEKAKINSGGFVARVKQLLKPTGYKPLLILLGLFVFQQFSGIYITLFYSVNFFQEVGSGLDPYFVSILIGGVRFLMSIINTYMLKTFGRRTLIIYGSLAMAVCMFVSGLYTYWIKDGVTTLNWVPVVAILLYVVTSMVGLLSIPWTMTAELFPIEIRGMAHSIVYSTAYFIMFLSIQSYNTLKETFNGVAGLQWFFAVTSLAGLVYAYILLPEAHGIKLAEIQEYFMYNSVYIGGRKTKKSVERRNEEQKEELMKNNV